MTTAIDLRVGDCVAAMASMEPGSVHAILTDPPYDLTSNKKGGTGSASDNPNSPAGRSRIGTGFMGKAWDATGVAFDPRTWEAALRVLKPGGYLVAFGSPRTHHRLMVAIEDAGFELRDVICWLYGTGFPKSRNVSKDLDKVGALDASREWDGWGTALKPAWEPIVMARKPLDGTIAANVLEHGTGAINIDATRIGMAAHDDYGRSTTRADGTLSLSRSDGYGLGARPYEPGSGRWSANVALDPEAGGLLDEQVSPSTSRIGKPREAASGNGWGMTATGAEYDDKGGPSRFYYIAKASRQEREFGLDTFDEVRRSDGREKDIENPRLRTTDRRNHHPTVKPLSLMRWLTRMIVPPGATVLDPFLGSGTTGIAVALEDPEASFIGMDLDQEYVDIAETRIEAWQVAQAAGEVT